MRREVAGKVRKNQFVNINLVFKVVWSKTYLGSGFFCFWCFSHEAFVSLLAMFLLLAFFAADFFASEICLLLRFSSVIFSAGNFCFWRFFLVFFASCIFSWVNLPYYRIPIGPTFRARARQNIHEINKLFTNVLFFTSKEYPWVKTNSSNVLIGS